MRGSTGNGMCADGAKGDSQACRLNGTGQVRVMVGAWVGFMMVGLG